MRLASTVLGSPPHTRGKEMAAIREAARNRITPAYAGKRPAVWQIPLRC